MIVHALRLHPGQDLRDELERFVAEKNIKAGVILTCVGSLTRATLRMADETITKDFEERFEITGLSGTLCPDNNHLHITISDKDGRAFGGHLKKGCLVYVTAELVIAELPDLTFSRAFDQETGFDELQISNA